MEKINVTIRVDKDLHDWLLKKAVEDERSLNSLGVTILKQYRKQQEKQNGND